MNTCIHNAHIYYYYYYFHLKSVQKYGGGNNNSNSKKKEKLKEVCMDKISISCCLIPGTFVLQQVKNMLHVEMFSNQPFCTKYSNLSIVGILTRSTCNGKNMVKIRNIPTLVHLNNIFSSQKVQALF